MKKLTDRQKKIAAVGVGGLLFLVFMLARARNAQNTAASTTTPDGSTIPTATGGGPTTGDLSGSGADTSGNLSDISTALAGLEQGVSQLSQNEGTIFDAVGGLSTGQASQQASIDALSSNLSTGNDAVPAVAPALGPLAVAPGRVPPATRTAAAAAVQPKTVVKNGKVYHYYDTDPKKAGAERKVYVRPASTAKRTPSTPHPSTRRAPAQHHVVAKPKPRPKPKPATAKKRTRR